MDDPNSMLPASLGVNDPTALRPHRDLASELLLIAIIYVATFVVGSLFIAACGPGCCYVFFSIFAGVSGILMLRQPFVSRCICLGVLLLSLFGMWHEKEVRDTWDQRALHLQIERLKQEIQNPNQNERSV